MTRQCTSQLVIDVTMLRLKTSRESSLGRSWGVRRMKTAVAATAPKAAIRWVSVLMGSKKKVCQIRLKMGRV